MKHLITAGLVLAALLLTACGREAKPIEVPPPVEAAPVVIDVPTPDPMPAPVVIVPAPKTAPHHSKPHQKTAPRPSIKTRVTKPLPLIPQPDELPPPPFEEFCLIGLCVAPPYRMEN